MTYLEARIARMKRDHERALIDSLNCFRESFPPEVVRAHQERNDS